MVFAKISTLVDATKLDENGHGGLVTNDLEYILVGGRNVYQVSFVKYRDRAQKPDTLKNVFNEFLPPCIG